MKSNHPDVLGPGASDAKVRELVAFLYSLLIASSRRERS